MHKKEANSVKIGIEQITPSHLFKSVNHTYITLTLDTAYQTKEKSCKLELVWQPLDI